MLNSVSGGAVANTDPTPYTPMPHHPATITWQRQGDVFTDRRYHRAHQWQFDGGAQVHASSSPHVVPLPYSDAAGVDPEEAFVASIASCHMLWFLDLACRDGWRVDGYRDEALGTMGADDAGRQIVAQVQLRPATRFDPARQPSMAQLQDLHHRAHAACFIANSVRTRIECSPTLDTSED